MQISFTKFYRNASNTFVVESCGLTDGHDLHISVHFTQTTFENGRSKVDRPLTWCYLAPKLWSRQYECKAF